MRIKELVRNASRGRHKEAGFTIAEVVVAVFVLLIIALAFYSGLSFGFSVIRSTREDLRATQILAQKLEAVRLCTWSQLGNSTFKEFYDPVGNTNGVALYSGTVTVAPATSLPGSLTYTPNVCLVTVNLYWTNNSASQPVVHSRNMQTQVARYGLQKYLWGAIK